MTTIKNDLANTGITLTIISHAYDLSKDGALLLWSAFGRRYKGQLLAVPDEQADELTLMWRKFIRALVAADREKSEPRLKYEKEQHIKRNQATYDYYRTKKGKYDR